MMIKIHLKSDINTKLNFLIEEEYIVYTGDNVSVDVPDNDLTKIKVYKEKSKKMSLWSYFLIIPLRIIRGFFDILIMNIPKNFVKKIEPYSFCGCFEIDLKYQRDISVNYQPSKYSEEEGKLILPVVKIDDKNIDLVCDLNLDSVNEAFREYCIHFISISFYSFLIFIIIFIMSYKTTMLWPLLLMFIALTVLIPAVKIYKEYTHMKKVKNKILEIDEK